MKINIFEGSRLVKVVTMNDDSCLEMEFSLEDTSGDDRYKVFCDGRELTLEGHYGRKPWASELISVLIQEYNKGESEFTINY